MFAVSLTKIHCRRFFKYYILQCMQNHPRSFLMQFSLKSLWESNVIWNHLIQNVFVKIQNSKNVFKKKKPILDFFFFLEIPYFVPYVCKSLKNKIDRQSEQLTVTLRMVKMKRKWKRQRTKVQQYKEKNMNAAYVYYKFYNKCHNIFLLIHLVEHESNHIPKLHHYNHNYPKHNNYSHQDQHTLDHLHIQHLKKNNNILNLYSLWITRTHFNPNQLNNNVKKTKKRTVRQNQYIFGWCIRYRFIVQGSDHKLPKIATMVIISYTKKKTKKKNDQITYFISSNPLKTSNPSSNWKSETFC